MGSGEGGGAEGWDPHDHAAATDGVDQLLSAAREEMARASAGAHLRVPPENPPDGYTGQPQYSEDAPQNGTARQEQGEWSNEGRSTGDDSNLQRQEWPSGSGQIPGPLGVGKRRTPRQQEQNKHAQQRYRARRKAQYEELQETVSLLTTQLKTLENERQRRQALEFELLRLREALSANGGAPLPSTQADAPPDIGLELQKLVPGVEKTSQQPLQMLIQALTTRRDAPSYSQPTVYQPPPPPAAAPAPLPASQVQDMLRLYVQELYSFMSTHNLTAQFHDRGRPDAAVLLPPDVLYECTEVIKMGIDLASLVLNAGGRDAEILIHDGPVPGLPCTADDPRRWRAVVGAVALTQHQCDQIACWRIKYLSELDGRYNERIRLKSQALQAMQQQGQGASTQWAEGLLMGAAEAAGYALCAQADAELHAAAEGLLTNVAENRSASLNALSELLLGILSPVQAVRYMASSHPFSWNVLAFSQAVAAAQNSPRGRAPPPASAPSLPPTKLENP